MNHVASPRILSLFSGVGGLELACRIVWSTSRVVGYVERDAYAASVLMARMEDAALELAPIFVGDIQDVDGGEMRGEVDGIVGGFPCQDISLAGRGEGIEGSRSGLWWEFRRLICEIRPRFAFLENVSAITVRGMDAVLGSLAEVGFDAEWMCLRASDVGAPHRRDRWFCLAYAMRPRGQQDAGGTSRDEGENAGWREEDNHELSGDVGGMGAFPPGPADIHAWAEILERHPHLAPAVESGVCRVVDGVAYVVDLSRVDRLRCCGNGVVPIQAACALVELLRRIGA